MTLVDVRVPGDYAQGHLQGAKNAPGGEMGSNAWDKAVPVVVYCTEDPCQISEHAAETFVGLGYAKVSILADGFGAWVKKGYPVVVEKVAAKPRPKRLQADEVKARIGKGDLVVLDCRPAAEYAAGHLKGAKNVPLETLTAESLAIPRNMDVLVYDRTALRGRQAAEKLMAAGYKVFEMPGGLMGWVKKGNALEMN